jgi:cysteine sulfinate desulfinase/cysteine desulfurase-like protein
MGYPEDEARGQLRISLGRTTTDDEVDVALRVVPEVLARVAQGSPIAQIAGVTGATS